jgi:hypothetical protein
MAYNDWLSFDDPYQLQRLARRNEMGLMDRAIEGNDNPMGIGSGQGPQLAPAFEKMQDIPEGIGKPKGLWDNIRNFAHVGLFPMGNPRDPEGSAAARSQALIAAGAGLLSGKNFGEAMLIAQQQQQEGLRQGGTLAYMKAQEDAMRANAEAEEEKLRREQAKLDKMRRLAESPEIGGDPERLAMAMIMSGDPDLVETGAKQMTVIKQRTDLYGTLPTGMRRLDIDPTAQWGWDPAYMAGELDLKRAGATNVNVTQAREKAYEGKRGEYAATRMNQFVDNIDKGRSRLATFDTALGMLDSGLDTGWAEGEILAAEKMANTIGEAFGFEVGDVNQMSKAEFFRSLSNQMALQLRNPSGGEGMPGQLSNRDLIFLQQSTIGLDKTEEGNRRIIEYGRALAKRQIEIGRMAQEWERANGDIDAPDASGRYFDDHVQDYVEKNHLFPAPSRFPGGSNPRPNVSPEMNHASQYIPPRR